MSTAGWPVENEPLVECSRNGANYLRRSLVLSRYLGSPNPPGGGGDNIIYDGGGIKDFSFDGSKSAKVEVDVTVVRTFGYQSITGFKDFINTVRINHLIVTGQQDIEHVRDLYVGDPLVSLNSGIKDVSAPNNGYDLGLALQRGSSDQNVAFIWDENPPAEATAQEGGEFAFISTTEDGSTKGDVTVDDYLDIRLGNLNVEDDSKLKGSFYLTGDNFDITVDNEVHDVAQNVLWDIEGNETHEVDGSLKLDIETDYTVEVNGNSILDVEGSLTQHVKGAVTITGDSISLTSNDETHTVLDDYILNVTDDHAVTVGGNSLFDIEGNETHLVEGNVTFDIEGGLTQNVAGAVLITGDSITLTSNNETHNVAVDLNYDVEGDVVWDIEGGETHDVKQNVIWNIDGDETHNVDGSLKFDVETNYTVEVAGDETHTVDEINFNSRIFDVHTTEKISLISDKEVIIESHDPDLDLVLNSNKDLILTAVNQVLITGNNGVEITASGDSSITYSGASHLFQVDNADEYDLSSYTEAALQIRNSNTSANQPHALAHFRLDKNGGDGYLGFVAGGSANDQEFVLGEQGDEWLRVDTDGNVGIGTDSPSATLEIQASASPTLLLSQDVSTDGLKFVADTTSSYVHTITHNDSGLIFNSNHAGGPSSRPYAFMDGNVGIGTDLPTAGLEVTQGDKAITLNAGNADSKIGFMSDKVGTTKWEIRNNNDVKLQINEGQNTNPCLTILNGGNVGIGTTLPDYPLDVSGYARATRMHIDNDYSIQYFRKTDSSYLGWLLMRDDDDSQLAFPKDQDIHILHHGDYDGNGNSTSKNRITIDSDGKVTAKYNFAVDGNADFGSTDGNETLDVKSHDLVDGGLKLAGTLVKASAAELNIMDAGATVTTPTVTGGDAFVMDDLDVGMRQVDIDNVDTYLAQTSKTLTNKTLTSPILTTPQINDTSKNHQYIFAVSELSADRIVTLPLLAGNDEITFNAHTQTLTNKRLNTPKINENVTLTATATELNKLDGGTSATATTLVDADRVVVNDADVGMKQVALTDFETYFESALDDLDNVTSIGKNGATLTVQGHLTVQGTTTHINSTTVDIDDKNIELGATVNPTDAGANGGGITLKGDTDKTIIWDNSNDAWEFNQHVLPSGDNQFNLGKSGQEWKDLYINGTAYLDAINFNGTDLTIDATELNQLSTIGNTSISIDQWTYLGNMTDQPLESETSHADVVVDGDFTSQGFMKRGADAGSYSIVADNSAYWNTATGQASDAYGWGDHASAGYAVGGGALGDLSDVSDTNPADDQVLTWDDGVGTWKPKTPTGGTGGGVITALNNATEDELVTVGAVTTELESEGSLTWNGTRLRIGSPSGAPAGASIHAEEDIVTDGDVIASNTSDINLKENIDRISNPLQKIKRLNGFTFDWKEEYTGYDHFKGKRQVGVSAQDVEEVMPELVTQKSNGAKAVNYDQMIPLLIEGMKEQQKQIADLEAKLNKKK